MCIRDRCSRPMDDCLIRIRRYLPSGRRTRHTAALLSVTIMTTIGMVVAGKAPSALACDINNHCYAVSSAVGADNYGVGATISISCLYAPCLLYTSDAADDLLCVD